MNNSTPKFFNPFFVDDDEEDRGLPQSINPMLLDDEEDELKPSVEPTPAEVEPAADVRPPVAPTPRVKEYLSSVVSTPKGKQRFESEYFRQDVVERIIEDKPEPERVRNKHIRPNGKLNGKELEFFKNMGMSKTSPDEQRLAILRGKVSGIDTPAAIKARNLLYGQAIGATNTLTRNTSVRFSNEDQEVLQFLAKFRYAKAHHLASIRSVKTETMRKRLTRLRKNGLVVSRALYGPSPTWFLTAAGMILSGYDLPRVTNSTLSPMFFAHTFTVSNIAANIFGGNVNVLDLEDFPSKNRVNPRGENVFGETFVGELEIVSSFGQIKQFSSADDFAPQLRAIKEREFDKWLESGGVSFGQSPERYPNNEWMWALLPPSSHRVSFHNPDFVIARDRNADGSPESIAVEVELDDKTNAEYEKTLKVYKDDNFLYKQVIWVCKKETTARRLENVSKKIGLWQEGRIRILPIITENGVWKERDMWRI